MSREFKYNIYMLGNFAVCPKCKGTVRELCGTLLKCNDCNTAYRPVDDEEEYRYLSSDRELVVHEIIYEKQMSN